MGSYKKQYEIYYSSLRNKKNIGERNGNTARINNGFKKNNNNYINKFFRQCFAAAILLGIILIIKNIPLKETKEVYTLSKDVVNDNLTFTKCVMSINIPKLNNYKERTLDFIDKCKSDITGKKTLKEIIKNNFDIPVCGKFESLNNKSETGIIINTEKNKEIVASYKGTVIDISNINKKKYITIDHGNGIESYYGCLSSTNVKEGDKVNKGEIIGRAGTIKDSDGIIYKIIYLGMEKDPTELINFDGLKSI